MGSFENSVIDESLQRIFSEDDHKETPRKELMSKLEGLNDKEILELLTKLKK